MNCLKIIAVDFDGCLCVDKWPKIGNTNWPVVRRLVERKKAGDKIILWTCREGALLDEAVKWCKEHDIYLDAVNDNIAENIALYGNNCRKVYADEYWDDKGITVQQGFFFPLGISNLYGVYNGSPMPTTLKSRLRFLFKGKI